MDWAAVCERIALPYAGLSDGAGHTLRGAHALPPDAPVPPCAIVVLRGLDAIEVYAGWMTGTALVDALVLLDPSADVPRRMAALLRWTGPAATCGLAHVQIDDLDGVSGCVPGSAEVSLAGDSPDYGGMPFDMVRVPYRVSFRQRVAVAP
jgi:hypothetical protein